MSDSTKVLPPANELYQRLNKWTVQSDEDSCWIWVGTTDIRGYGLIVVHPGIYKAHRLSWTAYHGPIPEGKYVCHTCDNRSCVNPDHLFIGSQADNMADMVKKGRAGRLAGEKNGRSRLTEDQAREILRLRKEGVSLRRVATMFGIGKTTVRHITNGTTWGYLNNEIHQESAA